MEMTSSQRPKAEGRKRARPLNVPRNASAADKLDAVNMRLKRKPDSAQALRRQIESEIDAKARRRRQKETSASSALRRGLSSLK